MSKVPNELQYTDEHEWIALEADGTLRIGITDHAQQALGDIVFLDLPPVGKTVQAGDTVGVVESVKAASDIYAPASGEIVAINTDAVETPEDVNDDPYETWLFKIKPAAGAASPQLLDAAAYAELIN